MRRRGLIGAAKKQAVTDDFVDLGLPSGTLWRNRNLGADAETDYGLYYAWAATEGHTANDGYNFNWVNAPYYTGDGTTHSWSKYNGTDGKTVLDVEDDAAYAVNPDWRMPSVAQMKELFNTNYVTYKLTTVDGVNGYRVTSKTNGNSIFMPAAGYRNGTSLYVAGSDGYYWSRALYSSNEHDAYYLSYTSSFVSTSNYGSGCRGRSVRPVINPNN